MFSLKEISLIQYFLKKILDKVYTHDYHISHEAALLQDVLPDIIYLSDDNGVAGYSRWIIRAALFLFLWKG